MYVFVKTEYSSQAAAIILSGVLAGPSIGKPYMGLVERISALAVHQWVFGLAWFLLRLR